MIILLGLFLFVSSQVQLASDQSEPESYDVIRMKISEKFILYRDDQEVLHCMESYLREENFIEKLGLTTEFFGDKFNASDPLHKNVTSGYLESLNRCAGVSSALLYSVAALFLVVLGIFIKVVINELFTKPAVKN